METEVSASGSGHPIKEKCPPDDDDVCLIKEDCSKTYCTFLYTPPQVNFQRPIQTRHRQNDLQHAVMQTIYIAEDSTTDHIVKNHRARIRTEEILEEVALKKENQYQQCKKQVEVLVFQPSKPKVSIVESKCEAGVLRSWQKEEFAERFMPVIRASPVVQVYQEVIGSATVQEYMVIEKSDCLLPEYTIDRRTGKLKSLIRRIKKLKRHKQAECESVPIRKELTIYECPNTIMPDIMMDSCGRTKGIVRRVSKPKFATVEECVPVPNEFTFMGEAAKIPSTQFCRGQGEQVSVPYQMSIGTGPMFEQALCAAVKELEIKEPFYTQVTPSDVCSPDQVTIVPESVFPKHSAKGQWTLRYPPNYTSVTPTLPKTSNQKLSGFQQFATYTPAEKPENLSTPAHGVYQPVSKPNNNRLTVPTKQNPTSSFTKFSALDNWRSRQLTSEQIDTSDTNTASEKLHSNYLTVLHNKPAVGKGRETLKSVGVDQSQEKLENELAFYQYMLCGKRSPRVHV